MYVSSYMASQMYLLQRALRAAYARQRGSASARQPDEIVEGTPRERRAMELSIVPYVGVHVDISL